MKNFLKISVSAIALLASTSILGTEIETRTTKGGWSYQYLPVEDAEGYKITIGAPTNWHFSEKNPMISSMGAELLNVTGFGDVLPVDKRATFENLNSNAFISKASDRIWAEIYVEEDEFDDAFPMIIGTINAPKFDIDEFAKIKEANINGLTDYKSQSIGQAIDILSEELLGNSGFYNSISLTHAENAKVVEIADIEKWYQGFADLGGIKIGVAGLENPEKLEPYIDEIMAKFNPSAALQATPDWTPNFTGRTIVLKRSELDKATMALDAPWPASQHALDEEISQMVAMIFGGDDQSRLFKKIRDELRATYGMSASISSIDFNHDEFFISGEVDAAQQKDVLLMIQSIVEDIKANGITQEEFERVKEYQINGYEDYLDAVESTSFGLAHRQMTTYSDEDLLTGLETLRALSFEDANKFIKASFPSFDQFIKVVVSPSEEGLDADCVLSEVSALAQCKK